MSFFVISLFRWLNLLSLDVVLIALAWQEVFARTAAITLQWEEKVLLAIGIWMVYIMDHWLDVIVSAPNANNAPRHHYVRSHRLLLGTCLVLAFLTNIWLLWHLSWNLIIAGTLLACVTGAYLVINHFFLQQKRWFKGREIVIAIIFSIGCALVSLVQNSSTWLLLPWIIAFAVVALINCTLIARMERNISINELAPKCFFSLLWTTGLCCVVIFFSFFSPLIVKALCWSLVGLAFIPMIARRFDYEVASLGADQVLFFAALLALFR